MKLIHKLVVLVSVVGFLSFDVAITPALACPMCKAALEEDADKPLAYQTSILFMLGMAMSVFGGMTILLTYLNRRETEALRHTNLAVEG